MGAWGHGPFDSDTALDLLADTAETVAEVDEDYDIVPGTVDASRVEEVFTNAFTALTAPDPSPGEPAVPVADSTATTLRALEHADRCSEAYTYAGVVAAVLAGFGNQSTHEQASGTRLLATITDHLAGTDSHAGDPIGLGSHCGYVALLEPTQATALKDAARAAVATLHTDPAWLETWSDPADMTAATRKLEQALT